MDSVEQYGPGFSNHGFSIIKAKMLIFVCETQGLSVDHQKQLQDNWISLLWKLKSSDMLLFKLLTLTISNVLHFLRFLGET